jgi:hypothetical protein
MITDRPGGMKASGEDAVILSAAKNLRIRWLRPFASAQGDEGLCDQATTNQAEAAAATSRCEQGSTMMNVLP